MRMKKIITMAMLFLLLFTGCSKTDDNETTDKNGLTITSAASDDEMPNGDTIIKFEAEVIEAKETLLVTPQKDSNEMQSSDKITVSIKDATLINISGDIIQIKDLKAGDIIEISYNGVIMESYPAQISADKVEQIGHNILLDGYLALIDNIYQQDNGLNGDITMIALDTTEWVELTEIEKEIILSQIKDKYQLETIDATYEELVEQGLINEEGLYFEQGILIKITNINCNEDKGRITCSLEKWRSGLGAIGSNEVTAKYKQGEWTVTTEGMWIS